MKLSLSETIVEFVRDWLRSRDLERLLWGVPAVVVAVVLIVIQYLAQSKSSMELNIDYRSAAAKAMRNGSLAKAHLYYQKAVNERPNDEATLLEAVLLADQMSDRTRRDALLNRLVVEFGYAPAILTQLNLQLQAEHPQREALDKAATALADLAADGTQDLKFNGVSIKSDVDQVRRQLAGAYRDLGLDAEALSVVKSIDEPTPSDRLEMAFLLQKTGSPAEALPLIEEVRENQTGREGYLPALLLAQVSGLQGAPNEALKALSQARLVATTPESVFQAAAAQVWIFEALAGHTPGRPPIGVLESLVAQTPTSAVFAKSLIRLAGLGSAHTEALTSEELEWCLTSAQAPVVAHLLAGLIALPSDGDNATFHFDFAHRLHSNSGLTLQTCAEVLAGDDVEATLVAELKAQAKRLTDLTAPTGDPTPNDT